MERRIRVEMETWACGCQEGWTSLRTEATGDTGGPHPHSTFLCTLLGFFRAAQRERETPVEVRAKTSPTLESSSPPDPISRAFCQQKGTHRTCLCKCYKLWRDSSSKVLLDLETQGGVGRRVAAVWVGRPNQPPRQVGSELALRLP